MTDLLRLAVDAMVDEEPEGPRVILGPIALQRFADLIRADAVPPGYVVVPVEPTEGMVEAAVDGYFAEVRPHRRTKARETYRAMLKAAPKENNNEPAT